MGTPLLALLLGGPGCITHGMWEAALEPTPVAERVVEASWSGRVFDLEIGCGFYDAALQSPNQLARVPLERPEDADWRGEGVIPEDSEGRRIPVEHADEDWVWKRELHAPRRDERPVVYWSGAGDGGLDICLNLPGRPLIYAHLSKIERSALYPLVYVGAAIATPVTVAVDTVLLPGTLIYLFVAGNSMPSRG